MDDKAYLEKRKNIMIKSLMQFKEAELDAYLPHEISVALRNKIMDEINIFADLALDLLDDAIMNEEFMDRLDDIYKIVASP
jgi:hypothetical protein